MTAFQLSLVIAGGLFFINLIALLLIFDNKRRTVKRIDQLTSKHKNNDIMRKHLIKKRNGNNNSRFKVSQKLSNDLLMSGILIRPSEFLVIWIIVGLGPGIITLLVSSNIIVAMGLMIIGIVGPPLYVRFQQKKRFELFEEQLVDAIGIICSSLKAGLTFQQTLVIISNEMPNPISEEFRRVARELKLGISVEKSLTNLSEKIKSKNFMMIVSAILIQRQTGGNLAEVLENIAGTIKERYKIKAEIKVLTATGRTSGIVVGLIPVFLILIFMVLNPSSVSIFFESKLGIGMLVVGGVMELTGFLFIQKIVKIKF